MEFKQLQSFVAVVKYGSFTKAAEVLFLSQPTISAHIRQLEEELQKRLILRTTKSFEVTPKGREVYEYALSILDLKERLIQSCSAQTQKIIHLGASTIPSAYILPEVLPEFGKLAPDTYFVIHQSDSQGIVDGLREGRFDIGLIGMAANDEVLECVPFCQDHMVLITPVNEHFLELKQQRNLSVQRLLQEPVILREKGSGSKKSADHLLESLGIAEEELHITARINDQEAIKNLVAGGLGVSIISERAARNFVEEKRLLVFELAEYASNRELYVTYRKHYLMKPCVQQFLKFIVKKYA